MPKPEALNSQSTAQMNSSITGTRQEASISDEGTDGATGPAPVAATGCVGEGFAVMGVKSFAG